MKFGCSLAITPNNEKEIVKTEEKVVIPEVEPEVVKPKRKRRKKNENK